MTAAMRSASIRPWGPLQALALPLLMMMARPLRGSRFMQRRTVAALTWLVVKVPAMTAGGSQAMRAMSGLPLFFRPTAAPAALKPRGSWTSSVNVIFDAAMSPLLLFDSGAKGYADSIFCPCMPEEICGGPGYKAKPRTRGVRGSLDDLELDQRFENWNLLRAPG